MSDNIQEIVRLEELAKAPDYKSSAYRWESARRIYAELHGGKSYRQLREELIDAGMDKGVSLAHLTRMKRCWEGTGILIAESGSTDFPPFSKIYHSDEVREPADRERRPGRKAERAEGEREEKPERAEREERDDSGPDRSAHGLTVTAADAIAHIYANRALWDVLSDDDLARLRTMSRQVYKIYMQRGTSTSALGGPAVIS